jgi:hypothetical protein
MGMVEVRHVAACDEPGSGRANAPIVPPSLAGNGSHVTSERRIALWLRRRCRARSTLDWNAFQIVSCNGRALLKSPAARALRKPPTTLSRVRGA